jgi:hypothetical protein
MSWLDLVRATEATPEQLVATGALLGTAGRDPIDGDTGWKLAGSAGRQVPYWTQEKARAYSVAAYRSNPMARAIIDTYTSFCVGDSGLSLQVTNPDVRRIAEEFWADPRNALGGQELWLRDQLLNGETLIELMQGPMSGVVRIAPVDPAWITDVTLVAGNPLWPDRVLFRWAGDAGEDRRFQVVQVDDETGLRAGEAMFWTPFKTLLTDTRSIPFLMPILDWLDSYDTVLSNLIDRTALARYLVWDVTVQGDQAAVDEFLEQRGGNAIPPSGSVEVHNESVSWEAKQAQAGAYEDKVAAQSVLTNIAGGSGLAKTWLAEPEDANRATSLTMAEPVRRRVGGVQKTWLGYQTELVRFAVDRAVAANRLPATVQAVDPKTGQTFDLPAAQSVLVTGPEVAAADAQITAQVLLNLSTGLEKLVQIGALSREGAAVAARKGWEDYMGVPYTSDLDTPDANPDDVAGAVDDAKTRLAKAMGDMTADQVRRLLPTLVGNGNGNGN